MPILRAAPTNSSPMAHGLPGGRCSGSGTSIFPITYKRKDPTASPLLASREQLTGLPRALIITAENDVLRDEGEAYGRKLIEAGVEVATTRYNATIHDFLMLNALAEAAPTRAAVAQAVDFLHSALAPKPKRNP